jgi:hypothetical protein
VLCVILAEFYFKENIMFWVAMCVTATMIFIASVGVVCNRVFEDVKNNHCTDWVLINRGGKLFYVQPFLFIMLASFGLGCLFNYLI